jgi:hypothetical protein
MNYTELKTQIKDICEKHLLSKKTFRRMAKVYHKQNFSNQLLTRNNSTSARIEMAQSVKLLRGTSDGSEQVQ